MHKPFAIFDMDGTLVASMDCWKGLSLEYLRSHGINEVEPEIIEKIKPMTISQSAQLFIEHYHLPGSAESVAGQMNRMMELHYRQDIPMKPGITELLEQLQAEGVEMCVASATAKPLMEACLGRLGVLDKFRFLLSCEEVGFGKDRPDIYLEAARRLGASPEDSAVYEDAVYAARTAKAAGFCLVAVYDPSSHDRWEELSAMADYTIKYE